MSEILTDSTALPTAGSRHMDAKEEEPSLASLLSSQLTAERRTKNGLTEFQDYIVKNPEDFPQLSPQDFKFLTEQLPVYKELPRAPTLAELQALTKKFNSSQFKSQFEDTWNSVNLSFAAIAAAFHEISLLVTAGTLGTEHAVVTAISKAYLAAGNVQHRAFTHFKHLASKQLLPSKTLGPKPALFSTEETKNILSQAETVGKIENKLRFRGSNNRYYTRQNRPWWRRQRGGRRGGGRYTRGRGYGGRGNNYGGGRGASASGTSSSEAKQQ